MNIPKFTKKQIESAVEIANTAGRYGFHTPNSRDMMQLFIEWAVEFESQPYDNDEWMELIDTFATSKFIIEVQHGRASCLSGDQPTLPSLDKITSPEEWASRHIESMVYLPESGDKIYSKKDFISLCNGDVNAAYELYQACDWQTPEIVKREERFGISQNQTIGSLAMTCSGKRLPLIVMNSFAGWYLGTSEDGMPYTRESVQYWPTQFAANEALATGNWTQKMSL